MKTEELTQLVIKTLDDNKAVDIRDLDVSHLTDITDLMIICSGSNNRHISALADKVQRATREHQVRPISVQGEESNEWILIDFGDIVVHIMQPETRDFYNLEKLWSMTEKVRQQTEG
ncbi:MAG: ribosome silencing factor [Gammaproteobacteria bacterium]|nr:ribosome silencing factor [Gammaproteobacteria bacterium]MCH9743363.1 ribosome silencing factor [Gammaproteobacteria bacterium]